MWNLKRRTKKNQNMQKKMKRKWSNECDSWINYDLTIERKKRPTIKMLDYVEQKK